MTHFKTYAFASIAAVLLGGASVAPAQISVGIGIGAAPVCPYGYFDYAPYDCAPYGYYGPDWFNGGLFIGAGPWYHGRPGWFGHVDNRFDPRHGYHGPFPGRGETAFNHFHGNEARDGAGHIGNAGHEAGGERSAGFAGGGRPGGGGHGGGHR
ncbi:hypothetical protein FTO74_08405 [Granulicella sp. WH15]|uniref:hypothetical protein n=1 Tax=Granulicella sp. WH15 TaxID=2602070 RepID=UPI0013676635|nr:hypothetical protein [Granulicella sp. WH15]QHN03382.1 hypothetical protein FTO74_08405 [Granulicella sp. WH15]